MIPGLDSTKEEFFAIESVFLSRGMATLSLDGPGQGEGGFHSPIRHDYEVAVTAALDELDGRAELDSSRVGAAGVSLGVYYAVRAAAFEPRLKAIAAVSGPYNMGAGWDAKPSLTREAFACYSRSANDDEARERARQLNLEGVAEHRAAALPARHRGARSCDSVGGHQAYRRRECRQRVGPLRGRHPCVQQHPVQVQAVDRGLAARPVGLRPGGYTFTMSASDPKPPVPAAPALPEVDSPPKEGVLSDVPSKEEIIESAQSAQDVLAEQPSVDELLGRDR